MQSDQEAINNIPAVVLSQSEINEKANLLQSKINKVMSQRIFRERSMKITVNENQIILDKIKEEMNELSKND